MIVAENLLIASTTDFEDDVIAIFDFATFLKGRDHLGTCENP